MKILASTLAVLLFVAPSTAQMDVQHSFEMMRASNNIEAAIDGLLAGSDDLQPTCVNPTDNCKSILDNLQLFKPL